jgi:DNA-binding response OmpR family regulator
MSIRIVIADDEPDLRGIYSEVLRRDGNEVIETADGREALAAVALHKPDLLVLDVWMPGLSGFEVLDRLRMDPRASTLKVLMLSNIGDSDALLEGFSSGAVDYLVKGIALEDFVDRVHRALGAVSLTGDLA